MRFIKTGQLNPDALDIFIEIQPLNLLEDKIVKRLDHLIGYIRLNNPDILNDFISVLEKKFENEIKSNNDFNENNLKKISIYQELEELKRYPDLINNLTKFYYDILDLSDKMELFAEKTKVKNGNHLRAFLLPRYYCILSLVEVTNRSDAITLYKKHVSIYLMERQKNVPGKINSLNQLFESRMKRINEPSEWVIVQGMLKEGKYAYRNDNCTWVDSLKDLSDAELKYYICCYGDYQSAKDFNENIILTMEHTIAQGDPYCSRVLHDTLIDWDLRHPPKEFWDNLKTDE